jgi:hypothetical protein
MTLKARVLIRLQGVRLGSGDATSPIIDWPLHESERIWLDCPVPSWQAELEAILTGAAKPQDGYLEELSTITVQTDTHQRNTLNRNQSIADFLDSPDTPAHVWLQNRRRALGVLVDLLGITPAMTRRPLKMEPPPVAERLWVLRFLLSRAELLLGSDIFQLQDAAIRSALARRWEDIPGCIVASCARESLPGPVDTVVRIHPEEFVREAAGVNPPGA